MPKTSTREMKINRIYTYLDEIAASEELDEAYIDDLLGVVREYKQMADEAKRNRMQ